MVPSDKKVPSLIGIPPEYCKWRDVLGTALSDSYYFCVELGLHWLYESSLTKVSYLASKRY